VGGRAKSEDADHKLVAKIRRLRSQGNSIRAIAGAVEKSPNIVQRLLREMH
jgi:transposase-like protein